jgi:hypothetical protein
MLDCLGWIRSLFTFGLCLLIFSSCATALFFKPTPQPQPNVAIETQQERLNTKESSKNLTTKGDIYKEKTIKILDSEGKPIRDGNTPGAILFIEVSQNLYLGETAETARFIKYLPGDDPSWVSDGRKTLPYSELGRYYRNKDELLAVQTLICAKQKRTYDENGYYIYEPKPVACPN